MQHREPKNIVEASRFRQRRILTILEDVWLIYNHKENKLLFLIIAKVLRNLRSDETA